MNLDKLKGKITEKRKTYVECAEAIGVSKATFNNKMNAKTRFTVPEFVRLADFLEMSTEERMYVLS